MLELILVSQSPRRREILENAGISFRVDTVKVSELLEENLNLTSAIVDIAHKKAQTYLNHHNYLKNKDILLLSADTMVVLDNVALGKPENPTQASDFLRRLSGKTHSVITGFCLINLSTGEKILDSDTTLVEFHKITEEEILEYIASGEPMDKAGAYAIQGMGGRFVRRYEGSYNNVVGLPIEKILATIQNKNWMLRSEKIKNE